MRPLVVRSVVQDLNRRRADPGPAALFGARFPVAFQLRKREDFPIQHKAIP